MDVAQRLSNSHTLSSTPLPLTLRLKEAEEARTICLSIEGLECSGELIEALGQHSTAMVELYRKLNGLISSGVEDESSYTVHFETATSYSAWFKSRKKVANSMKTAATSASG